MNLFEELVNEFIDTTHRAHGRLACPNDTHYSTAVVTESIQWIRSRVCRKDSLTEEGERFVAGAAAYLGYLAYLSFDRRGFELSMSSSWEPGDPDNHLVLFASRQHNGREESYGHDFLRDFHDVILKPPLEFPCMLGRFYVLTSLSLPTVESLYQTGIHYLVSPYGIGNWCESEEPLGNDDDFSVARELLIDDLHTDIGVPVEDLEFRQLSNWVVWPPYGWEQNDGQEYNLMTLVDQIVFNEVLDRDRGIAYLRALMTSQAFHLRNLAVRALLVMGETPSTPLETQIFSHALNASDHFEAEPPMLRFAWVVDGGAPDESPPDDFVMETRADWHAVVQNGPREPWFEAPIFSDGLYDQFGTTEITRYDERVRCATELRTRYPQCWFARVAYGSALIVGPSPEQGEAILGEAVESSPGDPTAHFTLGGYFCERGEFDEARRIYERAVKLCPWNAHAVGNAMWALTRELVQPSTELQS